MPIPLPRPLTPEEQAALRETPVTPEHLRIAVEDLISTQASSPVYEAVRTAANQVADEDFRTQVQLDAALTRERGAAPVSQDMYEAIHDNLLRENLAVLGGDKHVMDNMARIAAQKQRMEEASTAEQAAVGIMMGAKQLLDTPRKMSAYVHGLFTGEDEGLEAIVVEEQARAQTDTDVSWASSLLTQTAAQLGVMGSTAKVLHATIPKLAAKMALSAKAGQAAANGLVLTQAAGLTASMTAPEAYQRARDAGMSPGQATAFSLTTAALTAAVTAAGGFSGAEAVLRSTAGRSAVSKGLRSAWDVLKTEGGKEGLEEVIQSGIETAMDQIHSGAADPLTALKNITVSAGFGAIAGEAGRRLQLSSEAADRKARQAQYDRQDIELTRRQQETAISESDRLREAAEREAREVVREAEREFVEEVQQEIEEAGGPYELPRTEEAQRRAENEALARGLPRRPGDPLPDPIRPARPERGPSVRRQMNQPAEVRTPEGEAPIPRDIEEQVEARRRAEDPSRLVRTPKGEATSTAGLDERIQAEALAEKEASLERSRIEPPDEVVPGEEVPEGDIYGLPRRGEPRYPKTPAIDRLKADIKAGRTRVRESRAEAKSRPARDRFEALDAGWEGKTVAVETEAGTIEHVDAGEVVRYLGRREKVAERVIECLSR